MEHIQTEEQTTPEPTEAQLVAEEVNDIAAQRQGTPEMSALEFIMMNLPRFRAKLENGVTGVQAKRILSRLIESPLEEETAPFTTTAAAEVFNLGMQIQNAKHILFLTAVKENADKNIQDVAEQNEKQAEQPVSEVQQDNNVGVNNESVSNA